MTRENILAEWQDGARTCQSMSSQALFALIHLLSSPRFILLDSPQGSLACRLPFLLNRRAHKRKRESSEILR